MDSSVGVKLLGLCLILLASKVTCDRKFSIDYDHNTFVKDGKPFQYVSGSYHYARTHPAYWEDRFIKMRAAGLNAVQTYVPWNWHELTNGKFTWDGAHDLVQWLKLAQKYDIVVLLRAGPYMCGEWEFGGFPAWLLTEKPDMVLRSMDATYMKYVTRWFNELLPKIKPMLYNNGGPIGMVQIENEYGSYFTCDSNYTGALRDQVRSVLGDDVVLYSTDGGADGYLRCGKIKDVYATVDFGITMHPEGPFKAQRDYEPKGPLVNSEFYTGWLDHWGSGHQTRNKDALAKSLDIMLNMSANVNMYMYIGGTDFSFYNGANSPFAVDPTSYDYDSPISEAGDIRDKFYSVKEVVSKYLPIPQTPVPKNTTKAAYGDIEMKFVSTLQDALHILCPDGPHVSKYPVNMESIGAYYGFILYRFTLDKDYNDPTILDSRFDASNHGHKSSGIRDRAMVMVNHIPMGIMDRQHTTTAVNITGKKGDTVDILVENMGRVNYGGDMVHQLKGILCNVTLGGVNVTNWSIYPINLDNLNKSTSFEETSVFGSHLVHSRPPRSADGSLTTPSIYVGQFSGEPADTFLDPTTWGKGQAIINDFNIGRYWPKRGPQVTLYVPAPILAADKSKPNKVLLFEVESSPCSSLKCNVKFTDKANISGKNSPDLTNTHKVSSWKADPWKDHLFSQGRHH